MRRPLLLIACVLLAGCGNAQQQPPDVSTVARPSGTTPVSFGAQGVQFAAPGGWHVRGGQAPLVATVQSGPAQIAVWRYPRTEPLPTTKAQLTQARDLLLQAAKARDSTFKADRAAITTVGGHPAVQVRGTETVAGQSRSVRSTHVYADGGEVVVDAFAPADVFGQADRDAFRPLVRSLEVTAP